MSWIGPALSIAQGVASDIGTNVANKATNKDMMNQHALARQELAKALQNSFSQLGSYVQNNPNPAYGYGNISPGGASTSFGGNGGQLQSQIPQSTMGFGAVGGQGMPGMPNGPQPQAPSQGQMQPGQQGQNPQQLLAMVQRMMMGGQPGQGGGPPGMNMPIGVQQPPQPQAPSQIMRPPQMQRG